MDFRLSPTHRARLEQRPRNPDEGSSIGGGRHNLLRKGEKATVAAAQRFTED